MPGSDFDRLSHGLCSRHEARHRPRLRLAPLCSHARSRVAVAELLVVRRLHQSPVNEDKQSTPTEPPVLEPRGSFTVFHLFHRLLTLIAALQAAIITGMAFGGWLALLAFADFNSALQNNWGLCLLL